MEINENTKIFARLHKQRNGTGMNIYNPYFQKTGYNCVYTLFIDKDLDKLLQIVRNQNVVGAIPVAFEKDPQLAKKMDKLEPIAKKVGKVAIIKSRDGKLYGEYQGGYGIAESIKTLTKIKSKKIVAFGAGNVIKGMLAYMQMTKDLPKEVEIYNKTIKTAEDLANQYKFVKKVGGLKDMLRSEGDIFVSGTGLGQSWKEPKYKFDEKMISNFDYVADAGFIPYETPLIKTAKKLKKKNAPGYVMFAMQAKRCLEFAHEIKVDTKLLLSLVEKAFRVYK